MKLITITNNNFKILTRNLYESLKSLQLHNDLIIICFDQQSFDYLDSYKIQNLIKKYHSFNHQELSWSRPEFEKFCAYRIGCYNEMLSKFNTCLFIDSDIVFIKNPIPLINSNLNSYDIVAQNNHIGGICCGFFASNKSLVDYFNIDQYNLIKNQYKNEYFDDENFFNTFISKQTNLRIKILDEYEFPVGGVFYNNKDILKNSYLAHFNWTNSYLDKINLIKKYNLWRIKDDL